MYPGEESNLYIGLRRPAFYPLNYRGLEGLPRTLERSDNSVGAVALSG